jgi:hypothetical protein
VFDLVTPRGLPGLLIDAETEVVKINSIYHNRLTFETTYYIEITVSSSVMPYSLVDWYQGFRETYCHLLPSSR